MLFVKDEQDHIQFLKGAMEHNRRSVKLILEHPRQPGNEEDLARFERSYKTFTDSLKKLEKEYNEKYQKPETIKERALKKGLTVIRGGAL